MMLFVALIALKLVGPTLVFSGKVGSQVEVVEFSPDGTQLAVLDKVVGQFRIFDLTSGKVVAGTDVVGQGVDAGYDFGSRHLTSIHGWPDHGRPKRLAISTNVFAPQDSITREEAGAEVETDPTGRFLFVRHDRTTDVFRSFPFRRVGSLAIDRASISLDPSGRFAIAAPLGQVRILAVPSGRTLFASECTDQVMGRIPTRRSDRHRHATRRVEIPGRPVSRR